MIRALGLLLAFCLALASPAQATDPPALRVDSCGAWKHLHNAKGYVIDSQLDGVWHRALVEAVHEWNVAGRGTWLIKFGSPANVTAIYDASIGPAYGFAGQWVDNASTCGVSHWTRGTIKINPFTSLDSTELNRLFLTCHELGHGISAGHGGDGCMAGYGGGVSNTDGLRLGALPGWDTPQLMISRYARPH